MHIRSMLAKVATLVAFIGMIVGGLAIAPSVPAAGALGRPGPYRRLGMFNGYECVNLPEGSVPGHVAFTGTFTGVLPLGSGTYHYEFSSFLDQSVVSGTWSMANHAGSVFGTDTQTGTNVSGPPNFEVTYVDQLKVQGGLGAYASAGGTLTAYGTRTLADTQEDGCFETFHVSGLLISRLQMRASISDFGGSVNTR